MNTQQDNSHTFTREQVQTQVDFATGSLKGSWKVGSKTAFMIVRHCLDNQHTNAFIGEFYGTLLEVNATMARAFKATIAECTGMVIKEDKEKDEGFLVSKSKTVWKRIVEGDKYLENIAKLSTYEDERYIMKTFLPKTNVSKMGKKSATKEGSEKAETIDPSELSFTERVQYEGNIFQKTAMVTGDYLTKINACNTDDAVVQNALKALDELNKKLELHFKQVSEMKKAAVASRLISKAS
jgi:hypothetical protein